MKKISRMLIIGIAALILMTVIGWVYYTRVLENSGISDDVNPTAYSLHYVMITTDENSPLWNAVYQSAAKEAAANDAYLEYMKNDSMTDYTTEDFMKMAVNEKADGILVQGDSTTELRTQIGDAKKAGIPVVTMMQDSSNSDKVSFVGINEYELGKTYGQEILKHITDSTKNILVLLDENKNMEETSLMFTQIKDVVTKGYGDPPTLHVSSKLVSSANTFDSEEEIRTILLSDDRPDMLVCLNEANTESAYQALIDYNMVGKVALVGYYQSDTILSGIENGVISFTLSVSADELGRQAAEAMDEYKNSGYVSNYFAVQLEVISQDNAKQFENEISTKTQSGGDSVAQQ